MDSLNKSVVIGAALVMSLLCSPARAAATPFVDVSDSDRASRGAVLSRHTDVSRQQLAAIISIHLAHTDVT